MAWGGERGVVVVDMSVRGAVCALPPAALYHAARPAERQRSPSLDQVRVRPLRPLHATPRDANERTDTTLLLFT